MLGIKIRNRFLSLFADTALTFELSQPVGMITDASDVIRGGYSFPVSIPLDEINRDIIGHVDRLDDDAVLLTDEYCEIWVEGIPLYFGKATLEESTNSTASLFVTLHEVKELASISLSAIDLGGDRAIGASAATRLAHAKDTAANPLDYDYVFCPILNPVYGTDPSGIETPLVASHLQNEWDTTTAEFVEVNGGHAMPFIRVDYLLTRIFAHLGYTLDNQWQITDELRQLLLFNNYSIYADNTTWAEEINLTNHVPHRNCLEFIKAIMATYALGIFPDPQTKTISLIPFKTLIETPVHRDITHQVERTYRKTSDPKYISIFRYDIDTDDLLSIDYSGVGFPQNIVQGEGLTARALDAALDFGLRYIISDNSYYFIAIDIPGFSAEHLAQDHKRVTKTGTTLEYISPLIPMWSSWDLDLDGFIDSALAFQKWLVPHIRHGGYSMHYSWMRKPQTSFRTMLYRGMQPYDEGITGTYPMAGVTRYNIRGEQVGDYALTWDQTGGIYDAWWKLPYQMLSQKKTVNRRLNWTIADLLDFRFYHKYRIENQNYFFTHLRFTITSRGLSPIEATMFTTL